MDTVYAFESYNKMKFEWAFVGKIFIFFFANKLEIFIIRKMNFYVFFLYTLNY